MAKVVTRCITARADPAIGSCRDQPGFGLDRGPASRAAIALLKLLAVAGALATAAIAGGAVAQDASGPALVKALQGGGYVVVMRHASSPRTPPAAAEAQPDNQAHERQLDAQGRETAAAMGAAVKALHIPIRAVWSSPTYRALETVRLAGLPAPRTAAELGDGGQSMQAAGNQQAAWLKSKAAETPRRGADTLIVTHLPNLMSAFGQLANDVADGEALVFRPRSQGEPELVGRIKIEAWPALARR